MEAGDISTLGRLMDENQKILRWLDVSCPELDRLVAAAKEVGALGAKLVGAGCGGNMIALVDEDTEASVVKALRRAEASRVLVTQVG
jgi:mevalonate kinase